MNPETSNLLAQLRDIHGAPEPPWWPPAPGWWVLALLVLVALVFAARRGLAYWRRVRRRRLLLDQLDQLRTEHDPAQRPQDYLAGLNQLLKLVALRAFPDRHCAALQGPDWAAFIATGLDDREVSALKVLATGPYQPAPDFDAEAIDRVAREWVRKHG